MSENAFVSIHEERQTISCGVRVMMGGFIVSPEKFFFGEKSFKLNGFLFLFKIKISLTLLQCLAVLYSLIQSIYKVSYIPNVQQR